MNHFYIFNVFNAFRLGIALFATWTTLLLGQIQPSETFLQVYAPELKSEAARTLSAFVQAKDPNSGKIVWASDPTIVSQQRTVDPSQFPAAGVQVTHTVNLRNGVVEIPLAFSPKHIPTEGLKSLQLVVSGVIRRPDGSLAPFESRLVPVPFAALAGSAQSLTPTAVQNTPELAALVDQIAFLKRSEQALRSTNSQLATINKTLAEGLAQFREDLKQIRTTQLIGKGTPQFDVTGPVQLHPMGYQTIPIVFPSELNPAFLRVEDIRDYTGDTNKAYVLYSTNKSVVTVNLGQFRGDTNITCTVQSEGIIGESAIFMESLPKYLSVDRGTTAARIPVTVDVVRGGIDPGYPHYSRSVTEYSPSDPAWGGQYQGDSLQTVGFDRSEAYKNIKANWGGESFKAVNVIIATSDSNSFYKAGSKADYIDLVKRRIGEIYTKNTNCITPQEYFTMSTLGKSKLDILTNSVVVDLSALPGNLNWRDLQADFFKREYEKQLIDLTLAYRNHTNILGGNQGLLAGNPQTNWAYPEIKAKFGALLQFTLDPLITRWTLSKSRMWDRSSYKTPRSGLSDYNAFVRSDNIVFTTDALVEGETFKYRTTNAPGVYWIYIESTLPESATDAKYITEIKLDLVDGNYYALRSTELENTLRPLVNQRLTESGIDLKTFQVWWFPTIIDRTWGVPLIIWGQGGDVISFSEEHAGYFNANNDSKKIASNIATTAMVIHELGHTIQKIGDHYYSEGWNHSDAHKGRAMSVHDMMANHSEFADHILASKVSRGWIDPKLIRVFNPLSVTNTSSRFVIQLANLNATNLVIKDTNTYAGLEIRLADGNNLMVEYRGTNRSGFSLFQKYFTNIVASWDSTNAYAKTEAKNPEAYFKILETWSNLGEGYNTYDRVRSAQAQPPIMLAESDDDTVAANLLTRAIDQAPAQNLNADAAWSEYSHHLQLKHDGPFLVPSFPNQELRLQNLSKNALLENLVIKPSGLFNETVGGIVIEYDRYNRSNGVVAGPDPSIRGWRGNYQSPDIEVVNAWSTSNQDFYNLPHPDLPNEIRVTIHNYHYKAAKKVNVHLYVKDYNITSGPGESWSSLGNKVIDIEGNSDGIAVWTAGDTRGVFNSGETKNNRFHKCIRAQIAPWSGEEQVEGDTIQFEESGRALLNNEAQSNYSWTRSGSASPADIAVVPVLVKNYYEKTLEYEVIARPTNPLFQVFNPSPRLLLEPNEERWVPIGVQYLPELRDNYKPNYPSLDGHVSIVSVVHDEQFRVKQDEPGHDIDLPGGGASFKVFGGKKLKLVVKQRNKTFDGYFARPDGSRIALLGNMTIVLVKNETTTSRLVAPIKVDGSFSISGDDFTLPVVLSFKPSNAPEIGYHFETLPAL